MPAETFNDEGEIIMVCIALYLTTSFQTRARVCIQRENNDIVYQRLGDYFLNGLETIEFASACQPCRRKKYVSTAGGRSRNFLSVFFSYC